MNSYNWAIPAFRPQASLNLVWQQLANYKSTFLCPCFLFCLLWPRLSNFLSGHLIPELSLDYVCISKPVLRYESTLSCLIIQLLSTTSVCVCMCVLEGKQTQQIIKVVMKTFHMSLTWGIHYNKMYWWPLMNSKLMNSSSVRNS